MTISIRHLQHFIVVAQELHFRRAAQVSNIAQPALSRSIQTLESELGVQLLARNNRNVKLTAAGEEFLAGATDIVEAMQATIERSVLADQSQFGGVSIGYTFIAMCGKLPQLISAFEQQNPEITINPIRAASTEQLESLHRDENHFCFTAGPVDDNIAPEFDSVLFQTDAFVVIVSRNHPLANKGVISVEQLINEKILLPSIKAGPSYSQHILQFLEKAAVKPVIEYVSQNRDGILGLVALDRGVCIATQGYGHFFVDELCTLKLVGTDAKLPTVMTWRKDINSESALKFRNFVLQDMLVQTASPLSLNTATENIEPI